MRYDSTMNHYFNQLSCSDHIIHPPFHIAMMAIGKMQMTNVFDINDNDSYHCLTLCVINKNIVALMIIPTMKTIHISLHRCESETKTFQIDID